MSRTFARTLGVLALLAVPAAFALRTTGIGEPRPASGTDVAPIPGAAFTSTPRRDSVVVPPKPKRQIMDGVEVVVNIPSGRLELLQGDSLVKSYPVSVGSARYSTPVGDYLLATVIWNPWWNPPPGSAWAAKRKRTPPGPSNPMGRVKLHMDELIYIHGTTSEGRLGAPASHGCIRMSNSDVVDLARRVRMRVMYKVARVRDGKLHVYPDVYGRAPDLAAQVRAELARGGNESAAPDAQAMRYLRTRAYGRGASFALADLPTLRQPEPKAVLVQAAPLPEPPPAQTFTPDSAVTVPDAPAQDTAVTVVQP